MEAQAPSAYTSFLQQPWYSGRGLFLDPPTVYIKNKSANLSLPPSIMHDQLSSCDTCFSSLTEVFCKTRDTSSAANVYVSYISQQLSQYAMSNNSEHIAALIIEPGYYKYSLFWVPLFQYMMSLMLNLISLYCLFWYFSTCYVWTIQNLMLIFSGKCVPTDNFACAIAFTFTILNRTKYLCVRVGCTSIV